MNLVLFLLVFLPVIGFGIFLFLAGLVIIVDGLIILDAEDIGIGLFGLVFGALFIWFSVLIYQVDDNPVETVKSESLSERKQKPDTLHSLIEKQNGIIAEQTNTISELNIRIEDMEQRMTLNEYWQKRMMLGDMEPENCTVTDGVITCDIR